MSIGNLLKVLSALYSWLGLGRTLQLFSFGRKLLDELRKLKNKVTPKK